MTRLQRAEYFLSGLMMIAAAVLIMQEPEIGYYLIILILAIGLIITGIGYILYFVVMTRYMVGGKRMLYKGVFLFDFGIFTFSLSSIPQVYVLLYLVAIHAFSGLVEILRVFEARRNGSRSWKLKLGHGIINLLMAVCCFVFIGNPSTSVFIYSLGLIYSAVIRIITAFRRSTFVYIQ